MPPPEGERGAWRDPFVVVTALAVVANLALVWGFEHVAAQDHMNHVASLRVLRGLWEADPFYVERFRVAWRLVPDLLSEAIWFVALRPLGELAASKVILSLYALGLPAAWWVFLRRYAGGSTTTLPLAPLVTMNMYYCLGSTNYLLGLPTFIAACVAWDDVRARRSVVPFVVAASLTWLAHIYTYIFLMIFVAAHVAEGLRSGRRPTGRELAAGLGLLAGFAGAAMAVLSTEGEWAASEPPRFDLGPRTLLMFVDQALSLRGEGGTRYVIVALALIPASALAAAVREGGVAGLRKIVRPVVALAGALTLAAMWVTPTSIGVEGSIKERFAVPGFLLLFAAIETPRARWHRALAAVILVGAIGYKWNDERGVHARFDRRTRAVVDGLVSRLPRHANVLSVFWWSRRSVEETLSLHVPAVLVVTRDGFVPNLFDAPGQQILRYRRMRRLAQFDGPGDMTLRELRGFDHVWVQTDDPAALLANVRGCLDPVAAVGAQRLFRVRSECATAPSSP